MLCALRGARARLAAWYSRLLRCVLTRRRVCNGVCCSEADGQPKRVVVALVPALATHTAAGEVISPSHQRVKCPLCGDELRRESLAKHCASKHQDVLCVEEKKRAASPTPAEKSGVANLFARAAAKKARLSGVAAASEGAAVAGSANAARDDAPGAAQPGAALAGPVSGFPAQQVSERLTTLQYTALLKELAAARTELGALRAQVTKAEESLPLRTAAAVIAAQKAAIEEAADAAAAAAVKGNNIDAVVESCNLVRDGPDLVCKACEGRAGARGVNMPGVFSAGQALPTLKRAIARHLGSEGHARAARAAAAELRHARRRRDAAMSVARTAYSIVKEGASYVAFERSLVLQNANGADLGTLNHSRMFASNMVSAIFKAVQSRMSVWLDTPQPVLGGRKPRFAITADKSTELRRTGQILGALAFVEGEIKAFMLSNTIVPPEGDAAGLARLIFDEVVEFLPSAEFKERCSGMAFDGQYICEGVPAALRALLDGDAALKLTAGWMTGLWDAAHLAELALADVRKDKVGTIPLRTVEWYGPLSELLAALVNNFQYGKGYEELRRIAADLGSKMRDPAKFCDTRFASAERKVLCSFVENFVLYDKFYETASSVPAGATTGKKRQPRTQRSAEERAKHALLMQLRDAAFVGRVLVMRDILSHVSKFSLFAQTVNVLPWELREAEEALIDMLLAIHEAAAAENEPTLPEQYFPLLHKDGCWDELKRGYFKGVKLELPFVSDDRGTSDKPGKRYTLAQFPGVMIDEVADFCKALWHFFDIRFRQCRGVPRQGDNGGFQYITAGGLEGRALIATAGECFDLRKMCEEPCGLARRVEALRTIHAAAAASGVVLAPLEVLEAQLETLCSRLAAAAKEDRYRRVWFDKEGAIRSGTVVMKSLFTCKELYIGMGDVLDTFQACALKSRNEAVVEGIGSVVNIHADSRRGLSANKYSMEAFIHWNGPTLPAADGVVKSALDIYFEGKPWHFKHVSVNGQKSANSIAGQGLVVTRHKLEAQKLPFS